SDVGYTLEDAMAKSDDVRMFEGSTEDYAYDLVEDIGIEGVSGDYFDYESYGRDLGINGDVTRTYYDDLEEAKSELAEAEEDEDEDEAEEIRERIDDLEERIRELESMGDKELGEYVVDEIHGGFKHLSEETKKMYFDYDSLARDMELSGD